MGAVIVILEGQLLKVLEQVFPDIINDILAHLYHDLATDRYEDYAARIEGQQGDYQRKKQSEIFVRNGHVQGVLGDYRGYVAEGSAKAA